MRCRAAFPGASTCCATGRCWAPTRPGCARSAPASSSARRLRCLMHPRRPLQRAAPGASGPAGRWPAWAWRRVPRWWRAAGPWGPGRNGLGKASCHPPRLRAPWPAKHLPVRHSAPHPVVLPARQRLQHPRRLRQGLRPRAVRRRWPCRTCSSLWPHCPPATTRPGRRWPRPGGPAWPTVPMPAPHCRATACVATATAARA